MHLVIVHYHLNRGGVTQVIVNHLRALATQSHSHVDTVTILYGGRSDGWPQDEIDRLPFDVSLRVVPELEYDDDDATAELDRLTAVIADELPSCDPAEVVIHIHNHALGKNVSMPGAVRLLAERGHNIVLQIHDFAEDGRPANYVRLARAHANLDAADLASTLYPQASNIHYAVLNGRDADILDAAGIRQNAIVWLPNPVADFPELPDPSSAKRELERCFNVPVDHKFILYPVRGIRRKNLGELALYAALADERTHFGLTLAPKNPVEIPNYDHWRRLSTRLGLRCIWNTGGDGGLSFYENLAAADAIITTSVAEGFGMVFLETWLAGRPLIGRYLPGITEDFADHGIDFPDLSRSLQVPVEWIGGEGAGGIAAVYREMAEDYGVELDPISVGQQVRTSLGYQGVDFARLTREFQTTVIAHVTESEHARETVFKMNSWLREALDVDVEQCRDLIASNAAVVREKYSLGAIGERLLGLYSSATTAGDEATYAPVDGQKILDAFLSIDRFTPIRVEP